jgi:hypothetical integral membrane protein (TIGR02206 family)
VIAVVSPGAYWAAVAIAALGVTALCRRGRRASDAWRARVAHLIGAILLADLVIYIVVLVTDRQWSWSTSLPLALCDVGVLVAGAACLVPVPILVELTYFWGLAGTAQGVIWPDLSASFPRIQFFEYVVGHLGIVAAACFLVYGAGHVPRRWAVGRVFVVTAAYTALVGLVDALAGANYMFLRRPPSEWTPLRLLGPWPWYIVSAAAVAIVLFSLFDLPLRRRRPGTVAS